MSCSRPEFLAFFVEKSQILKFDKNVFSSIKEEEEASFRELWAAICTVFHSHVNSEL